MDVQCIKLNPTWSKGYARKGAALHGAKRLDDAIKAYEEGIKLEGDNPTSALLKGLKEVQDAKSTSYSWTLENDINTSLTPPPSRLNRGRSCGRPNGRHVQRPSTFPETRRKSQDRATISRCIFHGPGVPHLARPFSVVQS